MKRILMGVAALAALTLIVMVFRTLMIPAPQIAVAIPPIPVESSAVASRLSQALRFETVSYGDGVKEAERTQAIQAMQAWIEQTYPNFHDAAGPEKFGESLLFTWIGRNPNLTPVLLMAHMDVVPVVPGTEKDWTHAPFAGDIADGFVWGRGARDNKGQLIAILEAAERLALTGFQPQRTIMFAFGEDEETGGTKGSAAIAKALAMRGTRFGWVLDEGGSIQNEPWPGVRQPIAFVSTSEKGIVSLELTAHGEGGHSARPSRDLALPRLASAILNTVNTPFASDLDEVQRQKFAVLAPFLSFGDRFLLANLWLTKSLVLRRMEAVPETAATLHTTISPTLMNAGIKENVIPPAANGVINFRLHPRDTIASVTAHVRRAVDDAKVDIVERKEMLSEASPQVALDSPAFTFVSNLIQTSYGIPVAPQLLSGITDSRHYLEIADAVLRFSPSRMEPSDGPRVHGTNERIAVDDLGPMVGFYMRLMQEVR
jgi:carboxypeptidase PM20D1